MNPSMQPCELLSALADGQLGREDFAAALQACEHDESAVARWNTYHLIGDVLRSPDQAFVPAAGADLAFVGRLASRLATEPQGAARPGIAWPGVLNAHPDRAEETGEGVHHYGAASNDGVFRWKLVAGLASLAAVSALVWNVAGLLTPASAPQLAQAPASPQVVVASPQGPMVRDARLEELLAAHKQLGGISALQEPSGFLRNATFETPQNTRR